jgi:hypothetical protein
MNAEQQRIVSYWLPFFSELGHQKLNAIAALYDLKCYATPLPELVLRDLVLIGRLDVETESNDGGIKVLMRAIGAPGLLVMTPLGTKKRQEDMPRLLQEAERTRVERIQREEQERELLFYQQRKREEEERATKQLKAERLLAAASQQIQPTTTDEFEAYWRSFFGRELSPNDLAMIVQHKRLPVFGTPNPVLVIRSLYQRADVDIRDPYPGFARLFDDINRPDLVKKVNAMKH